MHLVYRKIRPGSLTLSSSASIPESSSEESSKDVPHDDAAAAADICMLIAFQTVHSSEALAVCYAMFSLYSAPDIYVPSVLAAKN